MKQLQRNLFIGLGGSGQTSLLEIKRSLMETNPDLDRVPEQVQFLAIDTDSCIDPVKTSAGKDVSLEGNEFFQVGRQGSGRVARAAEWWPADCADYPTANRGASQKRLHGRAKLAADIHSVKARIDDAVNKAKATQPSPEEMLDDKAGGLKVWIVCSLAGGTGAGAWYDVARLVRQKLGALDDSYDDIFGVFVTGDVFESLNTVSSVLPNTYACLSELQWVNTPGAAAKAIGDSYSLHDVGSIPIYEDPLFGCIFVATSKNKNRLSITKPGDLFTSLGRFLFFFAGEGAAEFNSWWSNKASETTKPVTNDHGERVMPLFFGLGISEIVLDSENVKKRDAQIFTGSVCDMLIGTKLSALSQEEAVSGFLERNGFEERDADQMLDRFATVVEMLQQKGSYKFAEDRIDSRDDAKKMAVSWKSKHKSDAAKWKDRLPQKSEAILQDFMEDLSLEIRGLLKKTCVANTIDFLETLIKDCESLSEVMSKEADSLAESLARKDRGVNLVVKAQMEKMGKGFVGWRGPTISALRKVGAVLGERLYTVIDLARTKSAINSFILMKGETEKMLSPLKDLETNLAAARDVSNSAGRQLRRQLKKGFFRQNVDFNDISASSGEKRAEDLHRNFLMANGDIFDSWLSEGVTSEAMRQQICVYVEAKISAQEDRRTLQDWFEQAGNVEGGENKIKQMIATVAANAQPFWSVTKGLPGLCKDPSKVFLGVENSETLAQSLDEAIKSELSEKVKPISTGDSGRLSMVEIDGPFPGLCIEGVSSWESQYSAADSSLRSFGLTPHIDTRFDEWVPALDPTPSDTKDLETWSMGILLGFIRAEKSGKFSIQNNREEGNPDSEGSYWVKTESDKEPSAYKEFKDNRPVVEDIVDFIASKCTELGDIEVSNKIKEQQATISSSLQKYTTETPTKIHLSSRYKALETFMQSSQ
jgi:hypothetical protein